MLTVVGTTTGIVITLGRSLLGQLPGCPNCLLDLPQGAAAIEPGRVERADFGERRQLVAPDAGLRDQVLDRSIPRFAVRGSRFVVRGSWFGPRGSRFVVRAPH